MALEYDKQGVYIGDKVIALQKALSTSIGDIVPIQDESGQYLPVYATDTGSIYVPQSGNKGDFKEFALVEKDADGNFILDLPTTKPDVANALYNDSGTVKISDGS